MKTNKPKGKINLEELNRLLRALAAELDNLDNGLRNCHKAAGAK
ncbi:MAG TPA: hypothetical protein VHP30_15240 [Ignavibacteriales bacterium]|nr:hypothetical protein [Ignavibacteriales bacterium]